MQPFLDIFQGDVVEGTETINNITALSKNINTKLHESSVTFNKDFSVMYFTRDNYVNGELGKISTVDNKIVLNIYKATKVNGVWTNIKELPFNSDDYSTGHPALSNDGKKLYFVSDMPGTLGETDIFVVDVLGNDSYSEPQNLGKNINTTGKEMFPFITENNILYFSSNKKDGYGGLDIYFSKQVDNYFSEPTNIGIPINSISDDFALFKKQGKEEGYFSSNRKGGKGDDDIYFYRGYSNEEESKICTANLKSIVLDNLSGIEIANAKVKVYRENKTLLNSFLTNNNGAFQISSKCNRKVKVVITKKGYFDKEEFLMIENKNDRVKLFLNKIPEEREIQLTDKGIYQINIGNIYFGYNKYNIRQSEESKLNRLVSIMNKYPKINVEIGSHTDSRGSDEFNMILSQKRAESTKAYLVAKGINISRMVGKGYGENTPVNNCKNGVKCSETEYQLNRRTEFIIIIPK